MPVPTTCRGVACNAPTASLWGTADVTLTAHFYSPHATAVPLALTINILPPEPIWIVS